MKPKRREEILAFNRAVKRQREKASDLDVIVSSIMKLPYGQLKKVLSDKVLEVFRKYGVDV